MVDGRAQDDDATRRGVGPLAKPHPPGPPLLLTIAVPPSIGEGLPVKQPHERQEFRRDVAERGEERCPRAGIVRAAAVEGHEREVRVELQRCAHLARQGVGAGPGLERMLEGARDRVEYGHATRGGGSIARGYPRRLAQHRHPRPKIFFANAGGTSARAKRVAACANNSTESSHCSNTMRCFERAGKARGRHHGGHRARPSRWNAATAREGSRAARTGRRRGGRRSGSVNASHVASSPGASGVAVRAISPWSSARATAGVHDCALLLQASKMQAVPRLPDPAARACCWSRVLRRWFLRYVQGAAR